MQIELLLLLIPILTLSIVATGAIIYFIILYRNSIKTSTNLKPKIKGDIEFTNSCIELINDVIKDEISYKLRNNIFLNERYDIKRLDTDLSEVITNVYASFNPSFFTDESLVISPESLMNYIIRKTSLTFLETVTLYNNNMRSV